MFAGCNHTDRSAYSKTQLDELATALAATDSEKATATFSLVNSMEYSYTKHLAIISNQETSVSRVEWERLIDEQGDWKHDEKKQLSLTVIKSPDSVLLSNAYLLNNIDLAFLAKRAFPWAKGIPQDIFENYLLPYKVLDEEPGEWRAYFLNTYRGLFDSLSKGHVTETKEVYRLLVEGKVEKWFRYSPVPFEYVVPPSFGELITLKKGDCMRIAYLNAYVLRSAGIPATIDVVPLWGSKNGGHGEVVFWQAPGKMSTYKPGRLSRSAKVFRITFFTQPIEQEVYQLDHMPEKLRKFLTPEHWIDVTDEHNQVQTIYKSGLEKLSGRHIYLYVYNYGQWEPIVAEEVNARGGVAFEKMGTRILYRIAHHLNKNPTFLNAPFIFDSTGNCHVMLPDSRNRISMVCKRMNNDWPSNMKEHSVYTLSYMDSSGEWRPLGRAVSGSDSTVVFNKMPNGGIYRLTINGFEQVARPFLYIENKQIWY